MEKVYVVLRDRWVCSVEDSWMQEQKWSIIIVGGAVRLILLGRGLMQHQGLMCQGSHASLLAAMGTTNFAQGACLQAFCNSVGVAMQL
jgi:hypothetical protein